jgi:hypothetical protein
LPKIVINIFISFLGNQIAMFGVLGVCSMSEKGVFMRIRLIILGVVGIFGLGAAGVGAILFKQAQDRTMAQYGEKAIALCDNLSTDLRAKGKITDAGGKLAVINASTKISEDSIIEALPADRRAQSKEEITGVLCVSNDSSVYDTDTYGSGSVTKYTCTRYQTTTNVYLFNAKTGALVAMSSFEGSIPPECPASTNKSLSKNGSPANPQRIAEWLLQ